MIYTNKTVKVLVIGLGSIALRHRRNLKSLLSNIEIIAVPSRGKILDQNSNYADEVVLSIEEAIKKRIDFAIIASPATLHLRNAKQLIYAGIPCLIEKPVTSNFNEIKELMAIQQKTNVPVCVGYCLRYMPSAIKMKSILEENILGTIYNIFIDAGQYLPTWRPTKKYQSYVSSNKFLGGGALLELSHEIDYALWFFGSMNCKYAHLRSSKELKLNVEDMADIILKSEKKNFLCNIHLDFLQKKTSRTCSIIGEKGRLEWDLVDNKIYFINDKERENIYLDSSWNSNQMYLDLLKDFINLINGRNNLTISLIQASTTIKLIEEIKDMDRRINNNEI